MNVQPNDQKRRTGDPEESPFTISTANSVTMGKPIGTFAGSEDFIMRIRNGKLVTADTGDQGEVKIRKMKVDQFLRRYGGEPPFGKGVALQEFLGLFCGSVREGRRTENLLP